MSYFYNVRVKNDVLKGTNILGTFSTIRLSFLILAMLMTATFSLARDFAARKKIDGYTVEMAINRNPPIVAKNELRVNIKDPQGKPINDLTVMVNYYMPPMPGMAPMNYTVQATPKSSGYLVIMDLIMTGPWNIVVKTNVAGKRLTASFPIDVR
jgi:nitrogen fixation protein FixH